MTLLGVIFPTYFGPYERNSKEYFEYLIWLCGKSHPCKRKLSVSTEMCTDITAQSYDAYNLCLHTYATAVPAYLCQEEEKSNVFEHVLAGFFTII